MGLNNREGGTVHYVKIKDGQFYLTKDETNTPYNQLEGVLTDMYLKDEDFQGQKVRKLYVVLQDGSEKYIVGMNLNSSYASTFLSFLMSITDLSQTISLSPMMKTETVNGKEVDRRTIFVSQNGSKPKMYFTKDTPNGLPQMKKVRVNGTDVWDKTEMLEFYEDLILKTIKPKLVGQSGIVLELEPASAPLTVSTETDLDQLPF